MEKEITWKEVITKAIEDGECGMNILNEAIMEISKSTKKKPGFIKFAVSDETAGKFMMGSRSLLGIVFTLDREYVQKLMEPDKEESA